LQGQEHAPRQNREFRALPTLARAMHSRVRMADLRTSYLGLDLVSPLVASSSPLTREISSIRQLEDAGAGAIVLFSLFEEQFVPNRPIEPGRPWSALHSEAVEVGEFQIRPPEYLDFIRRAKAAVSIPVIASLNVAHRDRWVQYAAMIEEAGANALELDLYTIPSDPTVDGSAIEDRYAEIIDAVLAKVSIPVSVKLSPYFTSVAAVAARFDELGVSGFSLFNRFYQPTIDIEDHRIVTSLELSDSYDGRLPLIWIAMLSGQLEADLAATGGVHTTEDAVRMIMAGASVAMLCSALLRNGIGRLGEIATGVSDWLDLHGHASIDDVRGVMSLARHDTPEDFKRAGYAKVLNRYW
jgi:dihydroorotate dehydrogenase (fumarate)